jgi:hypothetical protein
MLRHNIIRTTLVLFLCSFTINASRCDKQTTANNEPKTVAELLTLAGNTKRELRDENHRDAGTGISAQTDADLTRALLKANRVYKEYVESEKERLTTNPSGQPDSQKLMALHVALFALENPDNFSVTNPRAREAWLTLAPLIERIVNSLQSASP